MRTATSKDGTTIAFEQSGQGPALILLDGALQYRAFDQGMAQLAERLSPHFTVFHYDRRGRGDSTDTQPYSVAREIEDVEALIDEAGGSAFLYGISSRAALAFEAALALGGKVKKLAMYEAPYNDDDDARQAWKEYRRQLKEIAAEGRGGDAVGLFMMLLGMPAEQLDGMRQDPMWPMWEAVGHTLAYDAAAMGEDGSNPTRRAAGIPVPTLVMNGGASEWSFMHTTAVALAKAIPNAQHRTLESQSHEVAPEVLTPVLIEFFKA
ncbi:MAG TPA: alpha/beta hydrolase [Anaerolineales bacterium]|nr:alpha/beta hydrolase [Anaerolineales bacterium]